MYLLDTNVVSDARKRKKDPGVSAFIEKARKEEIPLYLSVLTLGEIKKGALMLARRDKPQSDQLLRALANIEVEFEGLILPVTDDICHEWGRLLALDATNPVDALFAATASFHGLKLVSRNEKHFRPLGVDCLNPFLG